MLYIGVGKQRLRTLTLGDLAHHGTGVREGERGGEVRTTRRGGGVIPQRKNEMRIKKPCCVGHCEASAKRASSSALGGGQAEVMHLTFRKAASLYRHG